MARRTIYVGVEHRRGKRGTNPRLGVAALRKVAIEVRTAIPRGIMSMFAGDYVAAGTRFRGEPEADGRYKADPVLKVRGDDAMRALALAIVARKYRVAEVRGHDRELIGGAR